MCDKEIGSARAHKFLKLALFSWDITKVFSLFPFRKVDLKTKIWVGFFFFSLKRSAGFCSELAAAPHLEEIGELFRTAVGACTQHTQGFFYIFLGQKKNSSSPDLTAQKCPD